MKKILMSYFEFYSLIFSLAFLLIITSMSSFLFSDLTHEKEITALRNLAYYFIGYAAIIMPLPIAYIVNYTEVLKRGIGGKIPKKNTEKIKNLIWFIGISFNLWIGISFLLSVILA